LVPGGLLSVVYVYYSLTTRILHSCGLCKRLVVFSSEIGSGDGKERRLKLPGLKEVRELHGWSQAKLAEESGVSRDSISNYETGHREPWPATAKRLADALGVEIEELAHPKGSAPSTSGQPEVKTSRATAHLLFGGEVTRTEKIQELLLLVARGDLSPEEAVPLVEEIYAA
jgi:transcriptional regulator with XRE-family HTH domain